VTVYVDDFTVIAPHVGRGRWSHMIADTEDELHDMATRIGLERRWFQDPRVNQTPRYRPDSYAANAWHYDVVQAKRRQAIALGAVAVPWRDLPDLIKHRMEHGVCRDTGGDHRE
jgi:hypothetical protein